ncbi:MAG: hypothetical protein KF791_08310 [Verrucomicrobiae bacterium]|nr:hypothetical protein [Verrucomicrobiae bacterium]
MAQTFTQARLVQTGEAVTSRDLASLAAAANTRLLSGVGDGAFRIAFYLFGGLFRQIRNPDSSFNLYPAQAEFFHFYQMLRPRDAQWPLSGPGDPEGTNVANPLVAFLQGAEAIGLESERQRLSHIPTGFLDGEPLTAWRLWILGSAQAGAYDPSTGLVGSPAIEEARAYGWVRSSIRSPHGNAYGGWLPTPAFQGICADEETADFDIFFTNLKTNEVRHFGTCPENAGDIAGIGYAPHAYYVFLNSGALVYLPKAEWIEGPYQQEPRLQKTQSQAIGRVLNAFAAEVRGTEEQRDSAWMGEAFAVQEFCTRQYALAPQVGVAIGQAAVQPIYATWYRAGSGLAPGAAVPFYGGSDRVREGNVCHGWAARAHGLQAPATLRLLRDGEEIGRLRLDPDPDGGTAEAIQIFAAAAGPGRLSVDVPAGLNLGGGGELQVEASERLAYKPELHDWALVTRLATYDGSFDRPDGIGLECSEAKKISDTLFEVGCVLPLGLSAETIPAGIDPPINQNALFDTARRMSQCVRIVPRWNLVGYAVQGGKSVLYLDRYARGMSNNVPIDLLEGIAPERLPIQPGQIAWGRKYRVKSGRINYGGVEYREGAVFTGRQGLREFESFGADVRETDGIRRTAEPGGFSNRWCVHATLKGYRNSESSIWKPEAYGDQVTPFLDRCHVDSPEISVDNTLKAHFTFGQSPLLGTESLPGQRYVKIGPNSFHFTHANRRNCVEEDEECLAERESFYRSCRIYEPPVEIESTEVVTFGGVEVVKLTLTGRLHHCEGIAPGTIGPDVGTWNIDALRNTEPYRSIENGLREYLVWQNIGTNASRKVGDWALNSDMAFDSGAPFGACLPTLFFVQLIPEPYLDDNDDQDAHDSPLFHDQVRQAELYLRAMCEGFIDGITTAEFACANLTIGAFDFTYENLHYAATGNRWIPWQPASVRPDNPQGFGPSPNTDLSAEVYNALARAWNLLTDARIYLPAQLEARGIQGFATEAVAAVDECGVPIGCLPGGSYFATGRSGLNVGASEVGDWYEGVGSGGANRGYFMVGGTNAGVACSGDRWLIQAATNDIEFRWAPIHPDALFALAPDIRPLLETDAVVAMEVQYAVTVATLRYTETALGPEPVFVAGQCSPSAWAWWDGHTTTWSVCTMGHRRVSAPVVPAGDVGYARVPGGDVGTSGGGGGSSSATANVIEDGTSIIRVPTVPYEGG